MSEQSDANRPLQVGVSTSPAERAERAERRSNNRREFSSRLNWWAATHAPWILVLALVFTLLALEQLIDLRTGEILISVDSSLEAISTESPEDRAYAEAVRRRFGDSEAILVVMQFDDVFTTAALSRIESLSRQLAALEGVDSVSSLTATFIPHIEDGFLRYAKVTPATLEDPGLPERLRRSTVDNPMVRGQLVSADGRAAALLVKPEAISEREMLASDLTGRIRRLADTEQDDGTRIYVTGTPVIRSEISATVSRQLQRVVPAIIVVVTVLLALAFPSLHGVLLPLLTIAIALIWTLGTLNFLGLSLNLITALVPPFLVTMGLAYCAHILSEFEVLAQHHDPQKQVTRNALLLKGISVPITITGFTTIAGLLALLLNAQRSIIEFAWLSVLGTSYLMILTLAFVPAVLRYAKPRRGSGKAGSRLFDIASEKLIRVNHKLRPAILMIAGIVFAGALLLVTRIQVDDAFVGIFSEDSRVRSDYDAVNRVLGGVNPLDISIDGGAADVFTDPNVLRSLDELQSWLRIQPEVGAVTGLPDHVRLLNRYIAGNTEEAIPDSRDAIRQMLFVGEGEMLRSVVNSDRSSTLIRVRLTEDNTAQITALLDRLYEKLGTLPPGLAARVTGSSAVMAESVRDATTGQLQSVLLALTLIYLCLSAQFMSLRIGLQASLPTVLQTALYFGALGLLGVPLNPTTILVECLVLGLAIDDTIHYLARFNIAAKRTGSETLAAASALRAVLRPVTLTKAILAIGFLTLVTGELRNQALFGWLAALTLTLAWLVDILVTPAFMSGLRIVTLWDTLRLDIGHNIQKTIPIFAGLTNRQARIFALMANLHTIPQGAKLFAQGDEAGSVYVVIEGEVGIFKSNNDDEQVEITRLGRGSVVGERGWFGQRRNATVEALTRVRLLRFDDDDQERICKSYPTIAAQVFLSLNRLQAERQTELMPTSLRG